MGLAPPQFTSQLPAKKGYEVMANPTITDGILDRRLHGAYTLNLTAESMRRKRKPPNRS